MKKTHTLILATLTLLTTLTYAAGIHTGEPAPDFTLTDSNGQTRTLKEFKGKTIILEWTNYQCPFVVKHYASNNIQTLQKKYTAKDIIWLSICSSAPGKQGHKTPTQWNAQIKDASASPTALLLDLDGTLGRLYAAKTTPHIYIINPQGLLIYQGAIDSTRSTNPKDIPTSTNYITQTLDALHTDKPIKNPTTKPYGCSIKY